MKTSTPTLQLLNANDKPLEFGMENLGEDGEGNQLWLHRTTGKVANRFTDGDGNVFWTDEIEGWVPVGYKLPRWLVEWMREQPESQTVLISRMH